jgi:hypothetical protein
MMSVIALNMLRAWVAIGIAVVGMGLVVSCGNGDEIEMRNTITEEQAMQRAEEYVRQSMAALPAEARLEPLSATSSSSCDDPSDNGPRGRVTVGNIYWVRGLLPESNPQYFDAMVRWWTDHDFGILTDKRSQGYVWVENKRDGFRMALGDNPKGELHLGADSPCVWPNGTPDPAAP